jgi:adenylate kinase family enzyme
VFWQPGWIEPPREEFAANVRKVVAGEHWILDGNYGNTQHIVLPAADSIVWLDLPRRVCMWRVIKRLIMYFGGNRPDLAEGCPEKVDFEFLEYVWNFPTDSRPRMMSRLAQRRADQTLIILRDAADVSRFRREMRIC